MTVQNWPVLEAPAAGPHPPADHIDLARLLAWARRQDPVRWTLAGMVTAWALIFVVLGWQRHDRFGTFGFDLGIYDQAIWLLSRFRDPFVTIRGLEFFGHHVNPALVLLVPFYWAGAGPQFLLVVQVVAQALGAVAVYLLARDRLGERWPAVALAAALLLHPAYQFFAWEYFHPDVLAIPPLLFAYWAARARRWGWFSLAVVLALACKEDVALAVVVLGVLIAARGDRRIGLLVSALSAAWFLVATRVVIPLANGIGPFYDSFFGDFGSTGGEVARNVVSHPGKAFDVATRPNRLDYYRMMLAPAAFLPLAAIPTLFLAAPMVAVNALSSFPYQQDIKYHYSALVLVGVILATVEAVAAYGSTPTRRAFLVGLVAATSLAGTVAWGPSPLSTKYHSGFWASTSDSRLPAKRAALALIPERDAASVHYQFAPHLTHRTKIYEWPVPWTAGNWGVRGENLHDPAQVRWLLVDRKLLGQSDSEILDRLLRREFAVRFERDDIVVARRVAPPAGG